MIGVVLHYEDRFLDIPKNDWSIPEGTVVAKDQAHRAPTSQPILRLWAGLNVITEQELVAFKADLAELEKHRICRVLDPTKIHPYEAMLLVEKTVHPKALQTWLDQDDRAEVKERISARIAERKKAA